MRVYNFHPLPLRTKQQQLQHQKEVSFVCNVKGCYCGTLFWFSVPSSPQNLSCGWIYKRTLHKENWNLVTTRNPMYLATFSPEYLWRIGILDSTRTYSVVEMSVNLEEEKNVSFCIKAICLFFKFSFRHSLSILCFFCPLSSWNLLKHGYPYILLFDKV